MDMDLSGKRALVCGASKGIGRATAQALAALGATVTIAARNEENLQSALATLDAEHEQQHGYLVTDFSDPAALSAALEEHMKGRAHYHILVNNSGGPAAGQAILAAPDDYLKAFTQHLIGNQIVTRALADGMKAEGYGRIVNVISTSVKQPIKGLGVSNTIRGAVASWSKTLAGELGPYGITVNNVLPGATDTDRMTEIIAGKAVRTGQTQEEVRDAEIAKIPAGRFAQPEETAAAIAFLCSPAAAYINGVNLPVDGGRTGSL
ncbi:MAG: SDR family oxidoreductase [Alphaproteobacteria bacterium]|nr:SDR family oxidoreductase [Alphaproteobacteria bacterium]